MVRMDKIERSDEKEILLKHGVRPLTHRVAVYRYLLDNPVHPTADEIYGDLKDTMSSISRTTVYNVLHLLCSKDIVQRIAIEKNEMRYDANMNNHIHFKCTACGHVNDLHSVNFPYIQVPGGYHMHDVQINITGECPTCSA